ncbi:MAG TPA: DNA repair protein RecO, partial [Actinobacteria bacterium]|nr:DNA repair protein RecO [Actinomycetota bacterium]
QVQIKKVRPWLRTDLEKLKTACAVLEMAEKLMTDRGQNESFLALTRATLDRLENERRGSLLLLAFDIKAIAMSGFLPNLKECVVCGSKGQLSKLVPAEGGCVCEGCYSGQVAVEADDKTKRLVDELIAIRMKELDKVAADIETISLVRKLIWAHIVYHIHGNFKTRTPGGQIEQ